MYSDVLERLVFEIDSKNIRMCSENSKPFQQCVAEWPENLWSILGPMSNLKKNSGNVYKAEDRNFIDNDWKLMAVWFLRPLWTRHALHFDQYNRSNINPTSNIHFVINFGIFLFLKSRGRLWNTRRRENFTFEIYPWKLSWCSEINIKLDDIYLHLILGKIYLLSTKKISQNTWRGPSAIWTFIRPQ